MAKNKNASASRKKATKKYAAPTIRRAGNLLSADKALWIATADTR